MMSAMKSAFLGGSSSDARKENSAPNLVLPNGLATWKDVVATLGQPTYRSVDDFTRRVLAVSGVREGKKISVAGLNDLFNKVLTGTERAKLATEVFPYAHSLVLALPKVFPDGRIKSMLRGTAGETTLTNLQVACLMASALFGLLLKREAVWEESKPDDPTASDDEDDFYPYANEDPAFARQSEAAKQKQRRDERLAIWEDEVADYRAWMSRPSVNIMQDMNFDRLFKPYKAQQGAVHAKLQCLFTFFETRMEEGVGRDVGAVLPKRMSDRLAAQAPAAPAAPPAAGAPDSEQKAEVPSPSGSVTVIRRHVSSDDIKSLFSSDALAANKTPLVRMVVRGSGTFEDDAPNMLQTDFANKFIGSSVLEGGCVQEQIRFSINPECMVSMGLCDVMADNEAIIITGTQRISNGKGYDKNFKYAGPAVDKTPLDNKGRRSTTIVGIDAIKFDRQQEILQFSEKGMLRDIVKAYAGYSISDAELGYKCTGVATGNWGCGAFYGAVDLKSMLLWIVVSLTGREIHYFPYGDKRAAPLQSVVDAVRAYKRAGGAAAAAAAPEAADASGESKSSAWSTEVTVGDLWTLLRDFVKGNEKAYSAAYYPQKKHRAPALIARPPPAVPDLYGHVLRTFGAAPQSS